MFSQLLESDRRPTRSAPQSFLSLAFHLAIGIGAIEGSRQVAAPVAGPVVDTQIVFTMEPPLSPPVAHFLPDAPKWTTEAPVPDEFVVQVPIDIPSGIPPVDPGRPNERWRFSLVPSRPACDGCAGQPPDSTTVFTEQSVDDPVQIVAQPRPVYPKVFESMGIAGRATIEFVVMATGGVDPGSIRVVEASHPAFGASAAKAIEASTFRPARVRGAAVKQVVRQLVRFEGGIR